MVANDLAMQGTRAYGSLDKLQLCVLVKLAAGGWVPSVVIGTQIYLIFTIGNYILSGLDPTSELQ